MSKNNPIIKLIYTRTLFDLTVLKIGWRLVTTATCDGKIITKVYKRGSRSPVSSKSTVCAPEEFEALCKRLEDCIATADRHSTYVDDSDEELTLVYRHCRTETVGRGLENERGSIGRIMHEFIGAHCDEA